MIKYYNNFTPWILERGLDYFQSDLVKIIDATATNIVPVVSGTEEYQVNIVLDSEGIAEMHCTCPYAKDGKNCKHMAAVLFKWEKDYAIPPYATPSIYSLQRVEKENTEEIMLAASEDQRREFLLELLNNDQKLLTEYKIRTGQKLTDTDFAGYKERIDHILREYTVRYGWIDYKIVGEFFDGFLELLNHDIEQLLENKYYKMAFDLTMYMFIEICSLDPEDSNGDLGGFCEDCVSVWRRVLKTADLALEKYIKECLQVHLDKHDNFYIHEYIGEVISVI